MQSKDILIVAITRLGDMLQASPTILGLKNQYPDSRITVIIDKEFASICNGIPGIDEVFVIDLSFVVRCLQREQDGIVEAFKYVRQAVDDLRERKFDYCLNMSNSAYTALLIKMLNIPDCRGWLSDEEGYRLMADPWAMLFAAFVYHSNRDYNSLNLVDIFRCAAEVNKHPRKLCFEYPSEAEQDVDAFLREFKLDGEGPLICIQAGASQAKRQWAPARFSYLTRMLVEELGARVVFTGTKSEQKIIDAVISACPHPRVISAVGHTNFNQLAALLKRADVLVTGDTGPMHVSVAVGTPVVALFLASALCFETGPYGAGNFVLQPRIDCNPCNPNYPCGRPDCHQQISPELVFYMTKLRLATPLGAEESLVVPSDVADPQEVGVYRTDFDNDGFLFFNAMNGNAARHGEPLGYFEVAQEAFRALWKEEFAGIPYSALAKPGVAGQDLEMVHRSFEGIQKTIVLCSEGIKCLEELIGLIEDAHSEPRLLGQTDEKRQLIDKELESVSLSYPLLGALIRVFIMEQDNLRGDDARILAQETIQLYEKLRSRTERFANLFLHFNEQLDRVTK